MSNRWLNIIAIVISAVTLLVALLALGVAVLAMIPDWVQFIADTAKAR